MAFRLFVDSSTGVTVTPEYNYKDSAEKVETRIRVRDGGEYVYKWGEFSRIDFDVLYVNSAFKSIVNSWWGANTDLLWMEEGATEVYSVHIINKNKPIDGVVKPYTDLFRGSIKLGTY